MVVKEGAVKPLPGFFSEPMQACLLDLAAQGPIPLVTIQPEYLGTAGTVDASPSWLNVLNGREALWDPVAKQYRDDIAD